MPAPPRDGLHSLKSFKSILWRHQRLGLGVRDNESRRRPPGVRSASFPDPRKGIAFEVAIKAERSRGAETAVIRVQGRVTLFTARRTDTAIMVVRHRNTSRPDANRR